MNDKIYELYRRIMKRDTQAFDDIETLEEAKEIIRMIVSPIVCRLPTVLAENSVVYDDDEDMYRTSDGSGFYWKKDAIKYEIEWLLSESDI